MTESDFEISSLIFILIQVPEINKDRVFSFQITTKKLSE